MYALVHKNKVIAGPMDWNRAFFSFKLRELGVVDVQLPKNAESSIHIIDSDTKIMAVETATDEINPKIQYIQGPIFDIGDDVVHATYVAVPTPLEFVRANFKNDLAAARYNKEIAGIAVNIQGVEVSIDTSREGRNIFIQTAAVMQDSEVLAWKFPETWLNITKPELQAIIAAGAAHIQTCFNWEKSVSEMIDNAQTAEELLEIHATNISKKE